MVFALRSTSKFLRTISNFNHSSQLQSSFKRSISHSTSLFKMSTPTQSFNSTLYTPLADYDVCPFIIIIQLSFQSYCLISISHPSLDWGCFSLKFNRSLKMRPTVNSQVSNSLLPRSESNSSPSRPHHIYTHSSSTL